jgi:hypothetical protein
MTKKHRPRTGLAAKVRAWLKDNPGGTSSACAQALGADLIPTTQALAKMAQAGMLSRVELPRMRSQAALYAYTLVREPPVPLTAEEARIRYNARQRGYAARDSAKRKAERAILDAQALRDAPKLVQPIAKVIVRAEPETVEQFVARGGVVTKEKPCQYIPSSVIPARASMRGASACP